TEESHTHQGRPQSFHAFRSLIAARKSCIPITTTTAGAASQRDSTSACRDSLLVTSAPADSSGTNVPGASAFAVIATRLRSPTPPPTLARDNYGCSRSPHVPTRTRAIGSSAYVRGGICSGFFRLETHQRRRLPAGRKVGTCSGGSFGFAATRYHCFPGRDWRSGHSATAVGVCPTRSACSCARAVVPTEDGFRPPLRRRRSACGHCAASGRGGAETRPQHRSNDGTSEFPSPARSSL